MELSRVIQESALASKKRFTGLRSKYWYIPKKIILAAYIKGLEQGVEDGMSFMSVAVENVLHENDEAQEKIIEEIQMMGLEIKYCL